MKNGIPLYLDSVNESQRPGVYRIPCECGLVYIGETQRRSSHYTTMHRFSLIFGIELCESLRDCLSKNCGFLSRFFTLKVLIFGRYVFVIVLFVTLIARFLFYVVVVSCFIYVNHALNYPWFRVSAHVTKVALILAGG